MTWARALLLLVVFLAVLQMVLFYGDLPDVMASHFDGAGKPNGYSSKSSFFILSTVILAFTVGVFGGVPWIMHRVPSRKMNFPNRDYWLDPSRREQSLQTFESYFLWLGVMHAGLALLILQMVIDANLGPGPVVLSSGIWWTMGLYTLLFVVWLAAFLRRFRLPETEK